ncbi:hypothetical protein EW026_g7702 [Hermanssonia centrifuga]|uniref:GH16 domain-containing protein n=1 Tax=Hermanssonia centrifuga TaxID=98765 RepID=A0A4S4K6W7_9APHY|nr:hypothetical protein EW026_g7702 [Hermanssonia centrifuga]
MKAAVSLTALLALVPTVLGGNFSLVQDFSGNGFFDGWTFYGNFDNLTNAYVSDAGTAIIKVDNTTFVPYNDKRNSVRITTNDYFTVGTVWIIDAVHLPFGCSVWPSIWTKGNDWPNNGEIDIIEGVNQMTFNQMALHTLTGCSAATGTDETGTSGGNDCSVAAGCTVIENTPNSYGQSFASNGGGVWATQFDVTGIFIWFWGRANVPASVTSATDSLDISTWGPPSAAYPASSCNIPQFFGAQQIVLDITLCGDWAGVPSVYQSTCGNGEAVNASSCYLDNVINNGTSQYADAYFELNYIRAFSVNSTAVVGSDGTPVTSTAGGSPGSPTSSGSGSSPSGSGGSNDNNNNNNNNTNGALVGGVSPGRVYAAGVLCALAWVLL